MTKFTDAQAEQALLAHYGNVNGAARALGVAHSSLWERIGKSERLQEARKEAEEQVLDLAEDGLVRAVKDGKGWAICFLLKTKGTRRGYVTRQEGSMTLLNGENPLALKLVDPDFIPGSAKLDYDPEAEAEQEPKQSGRSGPAIAEREPSPATHRPERTARSEFDEAVLENIRRSRRQSSW